jgi:hypothetical protein
MQRRHGNVLQTIDDVRRSRPPSEPSPSPRLSRYAILIPHSPTARPARSRRRHRSRCRWAGSLNGSQAGRGASGSADAAPARSRAAPVGGLVCLIAAPTRRAWSDRRRARRMGWGTLLYSLSGASTAANSCAAEHAASTAFARRWARSRRGYHAPVVMRCLIRDGLATAMTKRMQASSRTPRLPQRLTEQSGQFLRCFEAAPRMRRHLDEAVR